MSNGVIGLAIKCKKCGKVTGTEIVRTKGHAVYYCMDCGAEKG